ncbi:Spindle assembly abnormal protein 6 [Irineochytrium annulatum]|nr:Spindle assembly abnormal protein 6 [Irineochytrium annulatum]
MERTTSLVVSIVAAAHGPPSSQAQLGSSGSSASVLGGIPSATAVSPQQHHEKRRQVLQIAIRMIHPDHSSSGGSRSASGAGAAGHGHLVRSNTLVKILEIELTDENDHFFLYRAGIGEDDFHALRVEQNILVDFNQFPQNFLELLDECARHATGSSPLDEGPKFIAQLAINTSSPQQPAVFSIIETNSFKQMLHLSLKLMPGNDSAIKQHLAHLICNQKNECDHLKSQLKSTTETLSERLSEATKQTNILTLELDRLKIAYAEQSSRLELLHSQQISSEREAHLTERDALRARFERERKDAQARYEEQVATLTQRIDDLTSSSAQTTSRARSLEDSLDRERKSAGQLSKDYGESQQEIERLRLGFEASERRSGELGREVQFLRDRITKAEDSEREREQSVRGLEVALSEANHHRAKAEEALKMYGVQNTKLEENGRKLMEEVTKGNEIISKLQGDIKAAKGKIKLKNVVTLQQEKLLDERASLIDIQQKEITELKESSAKVQTECGELKQKVEDLTKTVEEGKQIISDNNNVIQWLHKQLNEDAIRRPMMVPTTTSLFPTYGRIDFDRGEANTLGKENTRQDAFTNPTDTAHHNLTSAAAGATSTFRNNGSSAFGGVGGNAAAGKGFGGDRVTLFKGGGGGVRQDGGDRAGQGSAPIRSSYFK